MAQERALWLDTADGRIKRQGPGDGLPAKFGGYMRNACRLTLDKNDYIPATDQLAKTTIWLAQTSQGSEISLFTGTIWEVFLIGSGSSVAVPSTANTNFDIFANWNGSAVVLTTIDWTNDTTRASAIGGQNGIAVLDSDHTKLYVGSGRTTGTTGQIEDSEKKRLLYNRFNRWPRSIRVTDATASWTYTTNTIRQANANTANQFELMCGFADVFIDITAYAKHQNVGNATTRRAMIGFDSTTTNSATEYTNQRGGAAAPIQMSWARFCGQRNDRFIQKFMWNEISQNTLTTTWYGGINSGLQGRVLL